MSLVNKPSTIKKSEAQIQASCVMWLHNAHPETRGLFMSVRNEDDGVSVSKVKGLLLDIINRPLLAVKLAKGFLEDIKRSKAMRGGIINAMGRISGASDTLFFWQGKVYCIEFKDAKGRQSPSQKAWEATISKAGFNYFLIRDLCSFQELIHDILKLTGLNVVDSVH